jgi:hypothetical protein
VLKIRSKSQLNEALDGDLAWRKREITTIKFMISRSRAHELEILLRSGICILYAHWEGFVKRAATFYLNYISSLGLHLNQLSPSLVAIALRSDFIVAAGTSRVTIHTRLTERLLSDMQTPASIPWENAVSARDNLNSDVLQEILCLVGFDYSNYATKFVMIDSKLLYYRNKVAHGENSEIDYNTYDEIHTDVIYLVNLFRNDVENAVENKHYIRR